MTPLVPPPATSGKGLLDRVEDALLPLINLVFLLLMFFIVAGQLANDPLPALPASTPVEQTRAPEADLTVPETGDWVVAGEPYRGEALLSALPEPSTDTPLRIAASEQLDMAALESLLQVLEQGGYEDVILLTEPGQ